MTRDDIINAAKQGWMDGGSIYTFPEKMLTLCVDAAIKMEREACAKVVENHALGYAEPVWAFKLIDTIRARGEAV